MRVIDQAEVRERLTFDICMPLVREAMIAFSRGQTRQMLRSVMPLSEGRMFGIMPGALGERGVFGAKLVSVFAANFAKGEPSHQGVVVLFDGEGGGVLCVADAGEITSVRTAAASAIATNALARADANRLCILGYGEQARQHVRAIAGVRRIERVTVWGRDASRAAAFAESMARDTAITFTPAANAEAAVRDADIVCAVTNARDPILCGRWLSPGAHVNLVGSSVATTAEADSDLVAHSRFIADSREGVLAQGGEFLRAKAAGIVDDGVIAGEIGEVLAGTIAGRESAAQITVYKSLGHIVQDLAAAQALLTMR